ncbi:MAG: aldo/keto reductase [Bacillota bacterium]|nr:aldo/keto reductase [Bacillota bacterium]
MQYRNDKYGNKLSILGYGCMRFTTTSGKIDLDKAEKEIMEAYSKGVNYYDTAYIYPGSEAALGEILERNQIREKVNIATKLPHYLVKNYQNLEKFFQEELKRLRTDYVDYYLMHMLTDTKTWQRLIDLGILEWLEEKKKSGAIRQIGFSYHGNSDMFCQLLDVYDWDFCQIQYNYLDEHSQAGRKGLEYAHSKGIPVIIMEPLRGGRLANNLPKEALLAFEESKKEYSPAIWAFKWLWNQEGVTCVLSGMNSLEMVRENTMQASNSFVNELNEEDALIYKRVIEAINTSMKVGCTGCRYCMPCPKGVDIPGTFAAYNRSASDGRLKGFLEYFMCTALRKDASSASNCIECGKCEMHCPQHIEIRKQLKNAKKELEGPIYKIARTIVKWLKMY